MESKGYVQVYTGNGKGKTTAALGLSLRAVCAGKKVFFGQFAKGMKYSELKAAELLPNFTMEQFGKDTFILGTPTKADIAEAKKGLKRAEEVLTSGEYDVVVFDEMNIALFYDLFTVEEILALIDKKPEKTELILTGRYAKQEIIDRADLVTEMKEIKHYYTQGVPCRVGIEN
ncbi:Cob(I)yrinic acid a,c-diamide adenosyltransferase [Clostridium liquoris]|jgi:cob(I)alamin adenosyltransferase|uniref:Cob(I)yrinic acid a,c-diamide adenosyltransferase n=1 Tax=Clostridium liquoris TaxID=1289519 RepID=A0A2T0B319_9CLOT|nr:cob(I)yrinic acid a,c-diamide adenosyltransferase [Clostridium liquoris]PRR78272.1 Cob(I)yrinic acid a,c-diamide adenosyltransferase [Clostridium liquoris]